MTTKKELFVYFLIWFFKAIPEEVLEMFSVMVVSLKYAHSFQK